MPLPLRLSLLVAPLLLLTLTAGPAHADPTPRHAGDCVAALEVAAVTMAQALRDGHPELEPELVRRVREGFAFIGSAWKQGVRKEEADRLLDAAREEVKTLPPMELAARQAACRVEGAELLAHANVFERAFVDHAAQKRVDKLKGAH